MLSAVNMEPVAVDPVLKSSLQRVNRANLLHWASSNVRDPGSPVTANFDPVFRDTVRDLVRRGLELSTLDSYRTAQSAVLRHWTTTAFELSGDIDQAQQLLTVSTESICNFLDVTVSAVSALMQNERDELTHGTHAERREIVARILDGATASTRDQSQLGYTINQAHTAAVMWSVEQSTQFSDLEKVAASLVAQLLPAHSLIVLASGASMWLWLPSAASLDLQSARRAMDDIPGVRLAIGTGATGIEGFRRSHIDALNTQRLMSRVNSNLRIATFSMVEMVALLTDDADGLEQFLNNTLGDLRTASPEVRTTVLVYIQEQCSASRAADRLFTHRNTVLRRVERATTLLPQPFEENVIHVAVALEALQWLGTGS